MKKFYIYFFITIIIGCFSYTTFAHPGRTDSNGGHYDRSTGEYHYHNGNSNSSGSNNSNNSDYNYDYDYDSDDNSSKNNNSFKSERNSNKPIVITLMIICFLLYSISIFLFLLCCEHIDIWYDHIELPIRPPSTNDLISTKENYIVYDYVEKVIKRSERYFELRKLYEEYASHSGFRLISLIISFFMLMLKYVIFFGRLTNVYIAIFTMVMFCIIGYVIPKFICSKFFVLNSFSKSYQILSKAFTEIYSSKDFKSISEKAAFNNFMLEEHYRFLRNNERTIRFRLFIKNIPTLICFAFFIYAHISILKI